MESFLVFLLFVVLVFVTVVPYMRRVRRKEAAAREAAERGSLRSDGPQAQHPHIDIGRCIGCGACVDACPEGDVLGVIGGKAFIVNGYKCIGHSLCADACPVGAIEIVMAKPSIGADMPELTPEYETNVPGLYIVGELGGLALIKNAVNQGRDCIDAIARRLDGVRRKGDGDAVDVLIVGAGPGGISASLRAIEKTLSYLTIEQGEPGGTVAKYPRQKLVMTSPVELPTFGRFRKLEISKEELLRFWDEIFTKSGIAIRTHERVEDVARGDDGTFTVRTSAGTHRARTVVLAIGRRGTPRTLGVPGEDLPKVMYSLIEADAYTGADILVVGGGDSAVEAAMGLAHQRGNRVTISYRQEAFSRIKERNAQRVDECLRRGTLTALFSSRVVEIRGKTVVVEVGGERRELPNDWVWVFAGGIPPNAFLEKIGVRLGPRDLTTTMADVR